MPGNPTRLAIAAALAISASCAPVIDGPVERQRAHDREDGDRLAAQLALLPGAVDARVAIQRPIADPLGVAPPPPAALTAVITTDDRAAPEVIRAAAARLAAAAMPAHAAIAVEVHPAVHRPTVVRVGPFWVEDTSRGALKATLALASAAVFGLAAALAARARRHRLGKSAQ